MALNAGKLWREASVYYRVWFNPPAASHKGGEWTNRYVEAMRASPYWGGHIDQVVHPLCFLETVVLLTLLWRYLA